MHKEFEQHPDKCNFFYKSQAFNLDYATEYPCIPIENVKTKKKNAQFILALICISTSIKKFFKKRFRKYF